MNNLFGGLGNVQGNDISQNSAFGGVGAAYEWLSSAVEQARSCLFQHLAMEASAKF